AGLGAKPIANTDCFFVGPTDLPAEDVPKGSLHPRRILRGIVAGVRDYGNRMGIPTVNGGVWFDEGYIANPLVYAGTVGILPHDRVPKEVRPGDRIVTVGGRTGRDGIHGATFSSIELSEDSEMVSSSAVQIGDPITEKRTMDCLLAARDRGLYSCVTDCGAGGFSSAIGEMGETTGADVQLAEVPLKYPGLASHEIWISEAQERMVLAVPPEHLDELLALFASEDVEATCIGTFTDTGRLVVRDGDEVVADLEMKFLHDGTPRPTRAAVWSAPDLDDPGCPPAADAGAALLELLRAPNIASKEWIVRQYDHEVQGTSVVKPLVGVHGDGPGDAAVIAPLATSRRALAISCGTNPRQGLLDPFAMTLAAIDEALRNAVAVGADPDRAAILDNFSWGNCDRPDRLGSLVMAAKACYDGAIAYRTPFVSGKDSLNNEYRVGDRTLSIPPTLLITCLAHVPDASGARTMDLKCAGNRLVLVGATGAELGGSHYLAGLGLEGGSVPRPDLATAPALLRALHAAMRDGLVESAHDLSEGGLAVAVAEMAFAGDLGARIDLASVPVRGEFSDGFDPDTTRLFSESTTRFLLEVAPERLDALLAALSPHPAAAVGEVTAATRLRIDGVDCTPRIDLPLADLLAAYRGSFQG
ncbi:MAG TPA: phosphoribosylformylglycinamidine synthase, partial [Planctomycetes bacterium]|nr:phosphoribosylformylglycinamidine synthase [Planctomycetota bacterium]